MTASSPSEVCTCSSDRTTRDWRARGIGREIAARGRDSNLRRMSGSNATGRRIPFPRRKLDRQEPTTPSGADDGALLPPVRMPLHTFVTVASLLVQAGAAL